jgi:hypothetical protein
MSNVAPVTVELVEPPHAPATIAAATAKVASSDLFRMCFLLIGFPNRVAVRLEARSALGGILSD